MTALVLLDTAGRRRSPATLPGYHCGRAPHNKRRRYPADPPPVEENIAVMRRGATAHGLRTPGPARPAVAGRPSRRKRGATRGARVRPR